MILGTIISISALTILDKESSWCSIYSIIGIIIFIIEYIEYNFSGSSYKITRETVEDNYPNYSTIVLNEKIDKEKFNELVENKMNDSEFVEQTFQKFGFKLTNNLKD